MSDDERDPKEMQEKLDEVGREIDVAKDDAEDVLPKHGRSFIDPGEVGADETDDAIVPPG